MTRDPLVLTLLAPALPGLLVAAPAFGSPDGDLAARVDRLEQRIDSLQAARSADWLTEQRAAEIRVLVSGVLADADVRTSLLAQDAAAGHDGDFHVESGDFRLEIAGHIQVRFIYNHLDGSDPDEDDDRWGWENRRTKLKFSGRIRDGVEFRVTHSFEDDGGSGEIQDAFIELELDDEMSVRLGRFRSPMLREERVSSRRQLLVERSLVRSAFNTPRAEGVAWTYDDDVTLLSATFTDRSDVPFSDDAWRVTARAEHMLDGPARAVRGLTSFRGGTPATMVGAGVLYEDISHDDDSGDDPIRLWRWTADLSMEFGGASLMAAVVGQHVDEDGKPTRDQYGALIQGGMFLTDTLELVARYAWGDADGQSDSPDLSVAEIGANYYFAEHDIKLTFDVGYGFNGVGGFWDAASSGWRRDAPDDDGQVVVRTQLQLVF